MKIISPPRYKQVLYQVRLWWSNKLVNPQIKQSIPTNKIASKQQEQFDTPQGNQVSQSHTLFFTPINVTSDYDDNFYTPKFDLTQMLLFVAPLGTEDT